MKHETKQRVNAEKIILFYWRRDGSLPHWWYMDKNRMIEIVTKALPYVQTESIRNKGEMILEILNNKK